MDGRTADTPTCVSASDVPGVSLMPQKLVLALWSDVAWCRALEEQNHISLWIFTCCREGNLL